MIEVFRIIEDQSLLYGYRATRNESRAVQLEQLITSTKPQNKFSEWHPLISTPFRYSPPHTEARFRPAYGKNVFYASLIEETALYEHAYHFMRERAHLEHDNEMGNRTIFSVHAESHNAVDIAKHEKIGMIMNKNNYVSSHTFIHDHPEISFILYPSCRDPLSRKNAAILNINHLKKIPHWESSIHFFYDNKIKQIHWLNHDLIIKKSIW